LGEACQSLPMVDIEKYMETEFSPTLRVKILRIVERKELTLGILLSRLKRHPRGEVLAQLQEMQDDGLVVVRPYQGVRRHTLMISKA
jgi:hypothetical protein